MISSTSNGQTKSATAPVNPPTVNRLQRVPSRSGNRRLRSAARKLYISVGGAGGRVLSKLKQQFQRPGVEVCAQFLVFDSDQGAQAGATNGLEFSNDEFVHLPIENMTAVVDEPGRHPHLARRFDLNDPGQREFYRRIIDSGADQASQVRPLGALALLVNFDTVRRNVCRRIGVLKGLFNRLRQADRAANLEPRARFEIVVVTSDAGGTGSGACHDLLALLRKETQGMHVRLTCVVVTVDAFETELAGKPEQWERVRCNALSFHQELNELTADNGALRRVEFGPSERDAFQLTGPIADEIIVVGRRTQDGTDLQTLDAVLDATALHLTVEGGTEVSDCVAADDANQGTLRGLTPDPVSRRTRNYSTLGATSVAFDADRCASLLASLQADSMLTAVIGTEIDPAIAKDWLEQPIADIPFSLAPERLGSWVRSKTLFDKPTARLSAPRARSLFSRILFKDKQFARDVRAVVDDFQSTRLPQIETRVTTLASQIIAKLKTSLNNKLDDVMAANGVTGGLSFLRMCHDRIKSDVRNLSAALGDSASDARVPSAQQLLSGIDLQSSAGRGDNRDRQSQTIHVLEERFKVPVERRADRCVLQILVGCDALLADLIQRVSQLRDAAIARREHMRRRCIQYRAGQRVTTSLRVELEISNDVMDERLFQSLRQDDQLLLSEFTTSKSKTTSRTALYRELVGTDAIYGKLVKRFERALLDISIIEILDEMLNDPHQARRAQACIQDACLGCQPLWLADPQSLRIRFSDSYVIGIPRISDGPKNRCVEQVCLELCGKVTLRGQQVEPLIVETSDPHRITIIRRVHGGRPEYLPEFREAQRALLQWRIDGNHPLHVFNKATVAKLPDLIPAVSAREAETVAAIGLAYGLIAKRGNACYLNVERGDSDAFVCRLASDRDCLVFHAGELSIRSAAMQKFVASAHLRYELGDDLRTAQRLGDTLEEGLSELECNAEIMELIMDVYQQLRTVAGDRRVADDLDEYLASLTGQVALEHRRFAVRQQEILRQLIASLRNQG